MPTWGLVSLVLALALPASLIVASLFLPWYALRTAEVEPLVLVAPFCMLWIVTGATLRRGFPEAAAERSA